MAQELWLTNFAISALVTYFVLHRSGATEPLLYIVGIPTMAVIWTAFWLFSPLPNRTVFAIRGVPMGDTQAGFWGFSNPEDEK